MPITGTSTAAADRAQLLAARSAAPPARRGRRGPPPEPAPRRRIDRAGLQRVDQRDGVGAAGFRGDGDRLRVGDVRRQLHDQRLLRQRPQGLQQRLGLLGCSPTIRPECTLGQQTLSSMAATSSRSATAADQPAKSSWLVAITETISGTGSSRQLRQILLEETLQALVGQPDRVEHPGRRLPDPPRLVPGPRLRA